MTKSLITINEQPISKKDFMSAIDNEIVYLNDSGNINHVMSVLSGLEGVEGITGHAKAKLLFGAQEWYKQNRPEDVFSDHVEAHTGIKKITVDRYITVWRYVEDLTIPKQIAERPMRELIPISKTISQGYEISKEQWRKIGNTSNDGELREILRQIKGKSEKKNARVIKLARDGSLYGWKNNERYFLGYLNVKDAKDDLVIAEFIEKIKISVGIIEE